MIDNFSLLLSHILLAIAFWRLLDRDELDSEPHADPVPLTDGQSEQSGGFITKRPKSSGKDAKFRA